MPLFATAAPLSLQTAPSAAQTAPRARFLGRARASDAMTFALHLPLRNGAELDRLMAAQTSPGSPFYHHWLTPAQFRSYFGPASGNVRTLVAFFAARGLAATQTSTQTLSVRGPARAVERVFATELSRFADARSGRLGIAAVGTYRIPAAIARSGATVLYLHSGHPERPHLRSIGPVARALPANRFGALGPYYADDLKQAYQYPSYATANGKGVNVAIVDGGDFSEADLTLYLADERIGNFAGALAPRPQTRHVLLPGAKRFDPNSNDSSEANLDAQQIAMEAPGATLTAFIVPPDDSDASFSSAYTAIVESNRYDVVSTSYGGCELLYTAAYNGGADLTASLFALNDLFKQGNVQGTTFVFSSGDNGALACPEPGYFANPPTTPRTVYTSRLGVEVDAALPTVVSVGGGELKTKAKADSVNATYAVETGYSDPLPFEDPYGTGNLVSAYFGAGGGVSTIFAKPVYQKLVSTGGTMRAVPDVGGHVGRYLFTATYTGSYDEMYFAGQLTGVLGTSASAPDFAALLAIKVQAGRTRLGLENGDIYRLASENNAQQYFHDAIPGNDRVYSYDPQHHGYNYVYGNGSPRGAAFAGLTNLPYANDPLTASNP